MALDGDDGFKTSSLRPNQARSDTLTILVKTNSDHVVFRIIGELDLATFSELDAQLAEVSGADFERVVLDLRDTTFIDSVSVAMLQKHARTVAFDGARLEVLTRDGGVVPRVLDVTGTANELRARRYDARDDAVVDGEVSERRV